MQRRVLKYVVTASSLVVLGGFWAFSTFVFDPFEDDYEYPLSTLIPRDVEFFLSKADLGEDFDPFPEPVFLEDFLADPRWIVRSKTLEERGEHAVDQPGAMLGPDLREIAEHFPPTPGTV